MRRSKHRTLNIASPGELRRRGVEFANENIVPVSRVSDAIGAVCLDCGAEFTDSTSPYWGWRKSLALHNNGYGAGHKVVLYGARPNEETAMATRKKKSAKPRKRKTPKASAATVRAYKAAKRKLVREYFGG